MQLHYGKNILIIYFLVFFLIGGIGFEFFANDNITYSLVNWDYRLLLIFLFSVLLPFFIPKKKSNHYCLKKFLSIDLQIILLLFIDSIVLYNKENASFRYSELGLSELNTGLLMYLYLLTSTLLNFLMLIYIFYRPDYLKKYGWKSKLLIFLFLLGILFSINGNATALLALFFIIYLLIPNIFHSLIFKKDTKSTFFYFKLILFLISIIPIFILTNIYGESIKRGINFKVLFVEFDLFNYLTGYTNYFFSYVLSPNYVSFKHAIVNFGFETDLKLFTSHIYVPIDNFIFRLKTIFGLEKNTVKSYISSYSRLNYVYITEFPSDREGTSPGLFASIFLSFPFPINFLVSFFSVRYLINFLDILVISMREKLTNVGLFVFLYFFIIPLISSPFDFFILLDNLTIYILLFIIFYNFCIQMN